MSGLDLLLQAARSSNSDLSVSVDRSVSSSPGDYKRSLLHSNFVATNNKLLHSSNISLSDSKTSLPPKKRMKLSFHNTSGEHSMNKESVQLRCNPVSSTSLATLVSSASSQGSSVVDSPTLNSEWTDIATTEAMRPKNGLLQLCDSVNVPKRENVPHKISHDRRSASKKKSNSNSDLKLRCGLSNDSIRADLKSLTDVDGNDMCMGYFSMPRRKSPPVALPTTVTNPQEEHQVEETKQLASILIHQEPLSNSATASFSSRREIPNEKPENSQAMTPKWLLYQAYLQALNQSLVNE